MQDPNILSFLGVISFLGFVAVSFKVWNSRRLVDLAMVAIYLIIGIVCMVAAIRLS